jgi:hypothetical protein
MQIELGAFAAPLSKQLRDTPIGEDEIRILEADADAISRLHVRGFITGTQADAARRRLIREIQKAM